MIEIRVPVLPESVADGTLSSWNKKVGDFVERDETLIDLETDKVVFEINATEAGILTEIKCENGSTVLADQLIAVIDNTKKQSTVAKAQKASSQKASSQKARKEKAIEVTPTAALARKSMVPSPSIRKLLNEHGLDAAQIHGTGQEGRILKADITAFLEQKQPEEKADASSAKISEMAASTARVEERVPMTRLRQRIAERLKEAQNTAAILTTFNEVNLQAVMDLRKKYQQPFESQHGVRIGFMSFFTKAVVAALKEFPVLNASIDGDDIVFHSYFDIGIALGVERGLVVPILRDADAMSYADIELAIKDFSARAQQSKLELDEITGGTFTITNGGIFGSMLSTPILNPPQSAILGMHKIEQKPVVETNEQGEHEIVIRPMMYLALSYDHRIIDGREAVQFLVKIKDCLENPLEDPTRMMLSL